LRRRRKQRGAVLLFAMIALVILLIGTVAMMRSMNNSLFTAGNFGFKRDLTNQSERAINAALTAVQAGGALVTEAARQANSTASNFSATVLPVNAEGIPNALLTDAAFLLVGAPGNDIKLDDMGVTVRYVVDRLCANAGPANPDGCTLAGDQLPAGSSESELLRAEDSRGPACPPSPAVCPPPIASPVALQVVYRVSVRVTGPRRTESFFQTTFTI